jgi:carboxyl-terminal processing protease
LNKKISLGAAIAYMAIVAAVVFCLTMFYSENRYNSMYSNITEREREYSLLAEIDQYARSSYAGTINEETLRAGIAAGYISGLGDPYARFLTEKEYEAYLNAENQRYVGIGVVTEMDADGYIRLKTVYPQSPAASAQMQPGDLIVSVDGTAATKENYTELVGSFQGSAGTKVSLVYRRDTEEMTVELTRREIDVPTISYRVIDNVGYLTFTGITDNSPSHLDQAIRQVTQDGAQALIFDVRGLSSENVNAIGEMLDILLGDMTTVYIQNQDGELRELMTSDEKEVSLPMVVLADSGTKGTSELFAQALKDTDKASVVGENTFGKGTYQEFHQLKNGSAVYLTVARYAGPSGVTYDETGVSADYEIKYPAEMDKASTIGNPEYDSQLRKALEIAATAVKTETSGNSESSGS